jgi:hypothetical protein
MPVQQRWILLAAGALWVAAAFGGGTVLTRYAYAPGDKGRVGAFWPAQSALARNPQGDTLVVAVHLQCPCTRASMVELNGLMLSLRGKVKAYVLVMRPHGVPAGWEETEAVKRAREIPGATVVTDGDGIEAARFGVQTSGQALLYDAQGRLLFNGGITVSRGHLGDNAGVQRITSLVDTGKADRDNSLVFGCPLGAKSCSAGKTDAFIQESKGVKNDEQP